jgi:hypothetical protein
MQLVSDPVDYAAGNCGLYRPLGNVGTGHDEVTIKIGYDKYDKEFWYKTLQKVNNVKTERGYQNNIRMDFTEVKYEKGRRPERT